MERVKYFVKELAHFHVPAAKDSISDLICKWCRLSNTSILLYYARNIFPFHHLLKCASYFAFHSHFLSQKRRVIIFLFVICKFSVKWEMNAGQTNGQRRTSVGRKWPNDSFEILFLLLCCSSSFKFLHLRLPIVFVSFRVLSNSLTPNVGFASCPNFVSRFIHKKRKSKIASEGGSSTQAVT